jgi:hypothetical protein
MYRPLFSLHISTLSRLQIRLQAGSGVLPVKPLISNGFDPRDLRQGGKK